MTGCSTRPGPVSAPPPVPIDKARYAGEHSAMRISWSWRAAWPWVLAAVPPLVVLGYAVRFHPGMPYWDEWHFIKLLEKSRAGTATWGDLWLPHNEHRPVITKLIFLGLAQVTGWSDTPELLVNVAIAAATLAVLVWQASKAAPGERWVLPVVSLVVCSLAQWENWLWGIQSMFFLAAFGAVSGLTVLAHWRGRWTMLALAAALGVQMTLSFALGVVYWPIGAALLVASHPWRSTHTRLGLLLWCAFSAAVLALFFHDYARVDSSAWISTLLASPLVYLHYVMNFIGGALVADRRALAAGVVGCALWLAAFAGVLCWCRSRLAELLPFAALSAVAVGGALIAGLGRQQLGTGQAVASRYVTFSSLFWVAIIVFLAALGAALRERRRMLAVTAVAVACLVAIAVARSSIAGGIAGYRWRYLPLLALRTSLVAGAPVSDAQLLTVHFEPRFVREGLAYLRAERLSLFRPGATP